MDASPFQGGSGALGEDRTPDPKFRKLVLYPTELRARWVAPYQNTTFAPTKAQEGRG